MENSQERQPPLLTAPMLERMAIILEVSDPEEMERLRKQVESALCQYKSQRDHPPPTPKKVRTNFRNVFRRANDLYAALDGLSPYERQIIDDASEDIHPVRLEREGAFGSAEILTAMKRIRAALRRTERHLPEVSPGPQQDSARWRLVYRLGVIFSRFRPKIERDGRTYFQMPTRRHDAYTQQDWGPFRDFVVANHEALGLSQQGVDDLIRSVWSGTRKKYVATPYATEKHMGKIE